MADDIAYARIHPAIGIARVGNSTAEDGWFYGPETPDPEPERPGFHKDASGAIKRQAARFRIYGYTAEGEVVRELTTTDPRVEITWAVHVANQKAAWYEFRLALDIDEAKGMSVPRRNPGVARQELIIDPGLKKLDASSHQPVTFSGGKYRGRDVSLGSMHADDQGRLVVLGGSGHSASPSGQTITSFGNNKDWYDDTSDGPVTATLTVDDRSVPVDPAWVVVAPPDYGPGIKTPRTLHDLLHDVFHGKEPLGTVNFERDIRPVLERFHELQWVNKGFATHFGFGGPEDFLSPGLLSRLADPSATNEELRRQVYTSMRDYHRDGLAPMPWPWIYGDDMSSTPKTQRQYVTLSGTQLRMLEQWAAGNFDTAPWPGFPRHLDKAPVADRPALLDRAALDFCLADAFHPGCELTWPMRHPSMYAEPFRIRHRQSGQQEPDYGDQLSASRALADDGPLNAQGPGGLTRWMAIPWQADTSSCRSGYESQNGLGPKYDPYVPTFWPARVPNHVLTLEDFAIVNTPGKVGGDGNGDGDADRRAAFARRASWTRGLSGDMNQQRLQAVTDWPRFGIVEPHTYTVGDGAFPSRIHVESEPGLDLTGVSPHRNLVTLHVPEDVAADREAARATIDSVAEATGLDPEDIAFGYNDKLDPFREETASGGADGGS